ncbi:DinB family protein [Stenotrophomonas maltophilia]|uniref:DinB family protein n=1 Tax=Stenotrophomonas maltophilia TaxID=40324 RepID=UPI0021C5E135|nr:DinB family protein [Stenotrophomonas maltophilia]MCU1038038.1 DinB family protein [Stenotrophomonas maltophilia]
MLKVLFQFKARSNQEILECLASSGLDGSEAEGLAAIRTLNHTFVVDQIFKAHLTGTIHSFAGANTPETPALADLKAQVVELDQWYVDYVSTLPRAMLGEEVSFRFTDGKPGRMTREEVLAHLLAHGAYHRGAVGLILLRNGVTPPAETFTRYLHETEPTRRATN